MTPFLAYKVAGGASRKKKETGWSKERLTIWSVCVCAVGGRAACVYARRSVEFRGCVRRADGAGLRYILCGMTTSRGGGKGWKRGGALLPGRSRSRSSPPVPMSGRRTCDLARAEAQSGGELWSLHFVLRRARRDARVFL